MNMLHTILDGNPGAKVRVQPSPVPVCQGFFFISLLFWPFDIPTDSKLLGVRCVFKIKMLKMILGAQRLGCKKRVSEGVRE